MFLACAQDGIRIEASPHSSATCPSCRAIVIPKCGSIVTWHWAHQASPDCDPWFEHETEWHLGWKKIVERRFCEVVIGPHRADIRGPDGVVTELQHSSISPEEIAERERFYGNMRWIFDVSECADRFSLRTRYADDGNTYTSFRWKHARKTVAWTTAPTWLDFGDGLMLRLKKIQKVGTVRGWGYETTRTDFARQYFGRSVVAVPETFTFLVGRKRIF